MQRHSYHGYISAHDDLLLLLLLLLLILLFWWDMHVL